MNPLLFTDPAFLFLFAPAVLAAYYAAPVGLRNTLLFGASIFLYAWGEQAYVSVLLMSMLINYAGGLTISRATTPLSRRVLLTTGVVLNLWLLAAFKYVPFLAQNYNTIMVHLSLRPVAVPATHLPAGISFYTFMGISYLIDAYRGEVEVERNVLHFGLYLSLFPHLIAGPIVRYCDIAVQLHARHAALHDVASGIRRFIIGLGKKVLIGNTVALVADSIIQLPHAQLTAPVAWIGIGCYGLQIYYDFSGYSDMAIGLARMFGFTFPENFNYPYLSRSITEFWKRWHITLSTWLRDYLFFPLGVRGGRGRLYRNVLIVFTLCGLWHGASWHFVVWGIFQGVFLVLERICLLKLLARLPRPVSHGYALGVILTGWALFRAENLPRAFAYIGSMYGTWSFSGVQTALTAHLTPQVAIAVVVGILGCMPVLPAVNTWLGRAMDRLQPPMATLVESVTGMIRVGAHAAVLLGSLMLIAAGTYHPFIYFRF
jgi:alginate O-acetyltransferase complex protein AlgI